LCCVEGQRTPTAVEEMITKVENAEVEGMDDRLISSGRHLCAIYACETHV